MDTSGRLFEGDVIAPEQYLENFTRTNNLEPEQELMLAILTDAVECILKYCEDPGAMRVKLFNEAQEWLFAQDERDPFSFLNVCEILNLDPNYLRRGIRARIDAWVASASERPGQRVERLKQRGGVKIRSHTGTRSRAGL